MKILSKRNLLTGAAGLGALTLVACGSGGRTVEGVVRSDYVEAREGRGVEYVLQLSRTNPGGLFGLGGGATQYETVRFPAADRNEAQRVAYIVKDGDRIRAIEGNIRSIQVTQPSDGMEIPFDDVLVIGRYEPRLQRNIYNLRVEDGMAMFDAYAFVPGVNEIEYTVAVPFQTESQLEDIKNNLTKFSGVQIKRGAERVNRSYQAGVPGRAAIDHPVTARRTGKGTFVYVDHDFLRFVDATQYFVKTPFNVPDGEIGKSGIKEPDGRITKPELKIPHFTELEEKYNSLYKMVDNDFRGVKSRIDALEKDRKATSGQLNKLRKDVGNLEKEYRALSKDAARKADLSTVSGQLGSVEVRIRKLEDRVFDP